MSGGEPSRLSLGAGTLGSLMFARGGKIAHYSSHDLSGGNADARPLAPGQTLTLVDHKGAGIVRRWWMTIAPFNNRAIQRQLIVRCYWDGESSPSVEVPVTDFFGVGFGEYHEFVSLPVSMTSGGYNCFWPMPFRRLARITVENRSTVPVEAVYFNIDIETHRQLPPDALYFHAQFRRAASVQGKPVTVLEATGRGQYVGTVLSMQPPRGRDMGFLEGDERVSVDGEATPSVIGTGTEDYFSSGWYFLGGAYASPYNGAPIVDGKTARVSAYRWHIEDAIPFERSLRFEIEHGGINDLPNVDYSSVAFWYQTHPHAPFPPLPANLLPLEPMAAPRTTGIIEGESLVAGAKTGDGAVSAQVMTAYQGEWSDLAQLFWSASKTGARLTLPIQAPAAREYELIGYFTRAGDYGDVQLSVNGQNLGPVVRGFSEKVSRSDAISFGRVALKAGTNEVVLQIVGKDPRSGGYLAGVDGFVLKP